MFFNKRFYVDRTYIWSLQENGFDDYYQYTQVIRNFAKEHNCKVDKHFTNVFRCNKADYLILKLKHPDVFYDNN